jgi:hypothetical protein
MTLWTPANDTSGRLYAWWDINDASSLTDVGGGVISQINDKSGNSRHWSQSTSAKRGTRTATNASFNNLGTLAVPSAGGYTALSGNITAPEGIEWSSDGTDFTAGVAIGLTAGVAVVVGASFSPTTFPSNGIHGVHWATGTSYGGTANDATLIYLNGNSLSTSNFGGTASTATAGAVFAAARVKSGGSGTYGRFLNEDATLLNRQSDWARPGDMDLGEMILLTGTVSTALRQLYEGYLAWKWGLQASLPGGHPYASAAPTVADDQQAVQTLGDELYDDGTGDFPTLEVAQFVNAADIPALDALGIGCVDLDATGCTQMTKATSSARIPATSRSSPPTSSPRCRTASGSSGTSWRRSARRTTATSSSWRARSSSTPPTWRRSTRSASPGATRTRSTATTRSRRI